METPQVVDPAKLEIPSYLKKKRSLTVILIGTLLFFVFALMGLNRSVNRLTKLGEGSGPGSAIEKVERPRGERTYYNERLGYEMIVPTGVEYQELSDWLTTFTIAETTASLQIVSGMVMTVIGTENPELLKPEDWMRAHDLAPDETIESKQAVSIYSKGALLVTICRTSVCRISYYVSNQGDTHMLIFTIKAQGEQKALYEAVAMEMIEGAKLKLPGSVTP